MKIEKTVWLIMTKDRKLIAKGTPRNRYLVAVNEKDGKRFLTYDYKSKAESGFKDSGFYHSDGAREYIKSKYLGSEVWYNIPKEDLEAVECKLIFEIPE